MQTPPAPSLNAQVEALAIAFIEQSKFLGKQQALPVRQLATVLKDVASASKTSAETKAALGELARKLEL